MIHNFSIATDNGIIQFGDDVNIYPVYLSRAIIICGNCLNWLGKTIVSDHILSISCKLIWELTYCLLLTVSVRKWGALAAHVSSSVIFSKTL